MKDHFYTMGVDVGGSYIKAALVDYSDDPVIVDKHTEKIRKRNPANVADEITNHLLDKHGLQYEDLAYLASTGEGEMVSRKKGHFYSMTTHARGGYFFSPEAKTVVDMGAFYVKAIQLGEKARVINYKMTGQCASGSGQFVENISRYLGLAIEELGDISLQADEPETPSGICAVLAETDVINMVSRGIATANIIKGIHLSVASRIIKLLTSLRAESPIALTGGMALNKGMVRALEELLQGGDYDYDILSHEDAIYAG
ncbi:MAG: BadF/BadG/BcrA/BcrD ATPase family protein, partial [bacterium]